MSNKFFGLYRATVTDNNDPSDAMRIKVLIPEVLGEIESPWALPCVPPGIRLVPEVNAFVWIEFEAGDPSRPVWVGTTGGSGASVVMKKKDIT